MRPLSQAMTSAPTRRSSTSVAGTAPLLAAVLAAAPASSRRPLRPPLRSSGTPRTCYGSMGGLLSATALPIAEGSFFDSVPGDGDAYVLKNIIHDWNDEKAGQILRNVRAAAGPQATVLLIEFVIPEHNRDFPGKWVDLEMMLNLGARERTAAEYRKPAQPSRIPDDASGANRLTAERGGGTARITPRSVTPQAPWRARSTSPHPRAGQCGRAATPSVSVPTSSSDPARA